jgi:hypothetical protein
VVVLLVVVVLVVPLVVVMVVPVVPVDIVPVVDIVSVDIVPVVPVVAVSVAIVLAVSVVTLVSVTVLLVFDSFLQPTPKRASAAIVRRTRKVFFISIPLDVVDSTRDFRAFNRLGCLAHLLFM